MAGVPTLNARDRARDLALLRDHIRDNPGIATKLAQGLYRNATLPGDVYQGKREATPEAGMDFALNLGMASSPVPRPTNSLGIFGGRNAKTYPHSREPIAEYMEKSGVSPDKIWEATGLGRGRDGKWRFEINDQNATLKPYHGSMEFAVGEGNRAAMSHPELKAAYPDQMDMRFSRLPPDNTMRGAYDPTSKAISLNMAGPDPRSTMLHELQHAVQDIEGFSSGSNPAAHNYKISAADKTKIHRIDKSLEMIRMREAALYPKHAAGDKSLEPELRSLGDTQEKLLMMRREIGGRLQSPYEQYRRNAGETEARNVQTRKDWGPQTRRENAPERTEDVSRRKQTLGDMLVKAMGNRS